MTPKYRLTKSPLPHGGARNQASRISDTLSRDICENIINASRAAYICGLELNRFITIHWQKGGFSDSEAAKATARFIKYCSDWMRNHQHPLVWIWVRENDGDKGRIGSHVHILLHVPLELRTLFRKYPFRWVKRISKRKPMKGMLMSKTVQGYLSVEVSRALYLFRLNYHVKYILKAASAQDAELLTLRRPAQRGTVIGKRAAVCQSLLAYINRHSIPHDWEGAYRSNRMQCS